MQVMTRIYSIRLLSAVVAAAIGGALLTPFMDAPAKPGVSPAGLQMMQRLRDDHAAIAEYLLHQTEAQKLANAAAAHEADTMKLAAHTDAPALPRIAHAVIEPKRVVAALEKKAAPPKLEPVLLTAAVTPGEPVQLLSMTRAEPPPSRAPLVGVAVGAVSGKLRQLAATVEHVPSWLVSAGDWVSDAVPVTRRPNWESRDFRATL